MSTEAYFVRVGDSEDELALYRKQDGETAKIIDGLDDRINVNPVDISKGREHFSLCNDFQLFNSLFFPVNAV